MLTALTTTLLHSSKSNCRFTKFIKSSLLILLVVASYYLSRYDAMKSIHSFTTVSSESNDLVKTLGIALLMWLVVTKVYKFRYNFVTSSYSITIHTIMLFLLTLSLVIILNLIDSSLGSIPLLKKNFFFLVVYLLLVMFIKNKFTPNETKITALFMFVSMHTYLFVIVSKKNFSRLKKSQLLHLLSLLSFVFAVDILPKEIFFLNQVDRFKPKLVSFFCKFNEVSSSKNYDVSGLLHNTCINRVVYIKPDFLLNREFSQMSQVSYQAIRTNSYVNNNSIYFSNVVTFVQLYMLFQTILAVLLTFYFWLRSPNIFTKVV